MAKNWYPIIDYSKCTGCLACVSFCPHGVFEEKNGNPVVVNPDACVEFCRGCQKGACENDAIMFPSDRTNAYVECSCTVEQNKPKGGE